MNIIKYTVLFALGLTVITACTDLDVEPKDLTTGNIVFDDPTQYEAFIAKIYAGLAVTGQQGPAGQPDIQGIDEGFSSYLRTYWKAQELSTDEAVTAWGDPGIQDFHNHNWTSSNPMITALYARFFYQIGLTNEFLRESTDAKLEERGITGDLREEIEQFRAEARFLRALSYWHALDMFRNIPFFTEESNLGDLPEQGSPQEVFNYIESELLAIESELAAPGTGAYGRADQAAAWAVLAKLYLNSEVYVNEDHYTEVIDFTTRIIESGAYTLQPEYGHLFLTDNNSSPEIIFPVLFDGRYTRSFGGMTFLTHMPVGGSMDAAEYGIDGGWFGMRATSALVDLFPTTDGTIDERSGLFYTEGQSRVIENINTFTDGIGVVKYRNVSSAGVPGVNALHPDTDFPMFRLADIYLMYAEAVLRGGGGSVNQAVDFINEIRERAYNDQSGNIAIGDLDLDFIIDERARELYWECHRRTDLVRFDLFSENGRWPWKGGVQEGRTTDAYRDIYPIPSNETIANTNLDQNPFY
ncbi:RagB/SusD family nutrient uptake outer membrane protein [Roseivirga sp. BDSF3-8]|uniref:RagB/SusD family nutrient uptake outer membrane protein n=1 Tax=Roseivirga sp. BDSF3-8 TaxID=3241598 RepID=UPI0035318061